ncbi:unnamed protein product [Arabidopsis halleri]
MDSPALLGFGLVFYVIFLFHNLPCTLSNPALLSCDSVFDCGNITASFPFWGENRGEPCGHPYLKLSCDRVSNKTSVQTFFTTSLNISNILFNVLHIDPTFNTLKLVREDYSRSLCSVRSFTQTEFPPKLFEQSPDYKNLIVFSNCNPHSLYLQNFTCSGGEIGSVYQNETYYDTCRTISNVTVPVNFVRHLEFGKCLEKRIRSEAEDQ